MDPTDRTPENGPTDNHAVEPEEVTVSAHEKVEGIDRVEDVVLPETPGAPVEQAPVKKGRRLFRSKKKDEQTSAPGPGLVGAKPSRRRVDLIGGFRDPQRRPRFLLWTGAVILLFAAFMIVALGVTSTRWFCSEACHKVQDDTIIAYERSPHSEISCMACHMPPGASPVVFILHKAEALGELWLTVRNDYSLPLNPESHVALTMASEQCTQCHDLTKRVVTPSAGVIIDHDVHAENEVTCGICHNRTAHVEDFELTLTDPQTGKPNQKHADFMTMTACFRCHTQGKPVSPLTAPGECSACHPEDFELKPASHQQPDFFPEQHGELAKAEASRVASATTGEEGVEEEEGGEGEEGVGLQIPKVETINECYTCHAQTWCDDCHGAPMPHPADFKENHADYGKEDPEACAKCHGDPVEFCNECHHSTTLNAPYDTSKTWLEQHFITVQTTGANACFECHNPTYCANCHVEGSSQQ